MKRKWKDCVIIFLTTLPVLILLVIVALAYFSPQSLSFLEKIPVSVSEEKSKADSTKKFWWLGKITFTSVREGDEDIYIYIMNPDGSNQTRLIKSIEGHYSWSPDGKKIACASITFRPTLKLSRQEHIYIVDLTTNKVTKLTSINQWNEWPAWSPDGKKIVFASSTSSGKANDLNPPDLSTFDIYVINADGTNQTRLTTEGGYAPAWSPDGKKIAFASIRDGKWYIYIMNTDGSNQTRLTEGFEPSWSPDGRKIVFTRWYGQRQIFTINVDGSNLTMLTWTPDTQNVHPCWSPDGKQIAFASTRDGNWEIYVMNADGSNQIRLTNNPAHDQYPAWSPP